jgi:hypothetical protein
MVSPERADRLILAAFLLLFAAALLVLWLPTVRRLLPAG